MNDLFFQYFMVTASENTRNFQIPTVYNVFKKPCAWKNQTAGSMRPNIYLQ